MNAWLFHSGPICTFSAMNSATIQCSNVETQLASRRTRNRIFIAVTPPPLGFLDHNTAEQYVRAAATVEAHVALLLMNTDMVLIPFVGTILPTVYRTATCTSAPVSTKHEWACQLTGAAKTQFAKLLNDFADRLSLRG